MFDSLINFRDLGGRPVAGGGKVRTGLLYRSESLAYASAADARRLVDELGLATVIDLRGAREIAVRGRGPIGELPIGYLHVPIVDVTRDGEMSEHYVAMLVERGDALAGLLRGLLAPDALPAAVHCEAGCDRTGVVSATVLGLLGVPTEVICADYELTRTAFPALNLRWRAEHLARGRAAADWRDDVWDERTSAMRRTVAAVTDRWGGWAGWATTHGLTGDELAGLRELLVEP